MLALLLSVLVNVGWGQNFTPVNYNFLNEPAVNSTTGFFGEENDPDVKFTYSAANGYGNWCVADAPGGAKWVLSSNWFGEREVSIFSIPNQYYRSPGHVTYGSLGFVNPYPPEEQGEELPYIDVKVATNLVGDVRYVWPITTRTPQSRKLFMVKGFSEKIIGSNPQILPILDISFTGLPKPPISRSVIKGPSIQQYNSVITGALPVSKAHPASLIESDWRDVFDIAMDARYLYITYETQKPVSPFTFEIWVTVVDINTDQVVIAPRWVGEGRRPTIACNVRNNSNDINPIPEFDIAYISSIPGINGPWAGTEIVMHAEFFNNAFRSNAPVIPNFTNPHNNSIVNQYAKPMHARMITSSAAGLVNPPKSIYVIADDGDNTQQRGNLYFHKIHYPNVPNGNGFYIDGNQITANRHPVPLNTAPNTISFEVLNEPLIGFANPYDGKNDPSYDEFHCLYRLELANDPNQTEDGALIIVRGMHNSFYSPDKRVVLNKKLVNSDYQLTLSPYSSEITGSVNQMGIHVNWFSVSESSEDFRFYQRDKRRFDENIEENTLVTGDCIVGDGTDHGGTKDVTLLLGKRMTIWSDPNFGVGGTTGFDESLTDYFGRNYGLNNSFSRGKLSFQNHYTTLHIGPNSNSTIDKAILTVLPNYEINFSTSHSGQKIIVHEGSEFHSYGFPISSAPNVSTTPNVSGLGTILLDESSSAYRGGKILVHGGSNLTINDKVTLELKQNSTLEFLNEPSITPPWQSTDQNVQYQPNGTNIEASGKMTLHGTFISNNANILAHVNYFEPTTVISVKDPISSSSNSLPTTQFSTINTYFRGGDCTGCGIDFGLWGMKIEWASPNTAPQNQYRKIFINDCGFYGAGLSITNPTAQVDILSSTFTRTIITPITMTWERSTVDGYGIININANSISHINTYLFGEDKSIPGGIHLTGFRRERSSSSSFDEITIQSNTLHAEGPSPVVDLNTAAIRLINTSALVVGNDISGVGFTDGIVNLFTSLSPQDKSNSYFCSNEISNINGVSGIGIWTGEWKGQARLNVVETCNIGHQSESGDDGGITFSRYSLNNVAGLKLVSSNSKIDISGIHTQSLNHGAFDTIDHNNPSGSATSAQIVLDGSVLKIGSNSTNSADFANFGQNTIVSENVGDNLIRGTNGNIALDINENYWGAGDWSNLTTITTLTGLQNELDGTFTINPTNPSFAANPIGRTFTPECDIFFDWGQGTHSSQQQQSNEFDTDSCAWLLDRGRRNYNGNNYKVAADTLRLYIERCYDKSDAWREFDAIGVSTAWGSVDSNRFYELLDWLKSVLYLNTTDSNYYCGDVTTIYQNFQYLPERGEGDFLGCLAIMKYVRESGRCLNWEPYNEDYDKLYRFYMDEVIKRWQDSVKDSLSTPIDTTLPSLEDLGLGLLRGQNGVASALPVSRLGELIATRNPFTDILELKYRLSKSAMTRIDVYDLLGKALYSEGQGYKPEGEYILTVQTKGWVAGSYYVRLSSPSGEVKTVKVVKE